MVRKNPNRDEWKMPLELVFLGQYKESLSSSGMVWATQSHVLD
jgi:hypothetical protein